MAGGRGTYSLSIRVRDIKVPPSPLRGRSGRLDDLFVRQRFTKRRKKMGKERKGREIWAPDVLVIEADPKHRPPAPRRSFRNHITHGCHGDYQKKEKNHRDYKSSGIIFWNQHGRTQGKSQNEEEERGRDAAACGTWKYTWMWAVRLHQLKVIQNPPQFCYCITTGETCKCIFAIWFLNISASNI